MKTHFWKKAAALALVLAVFVSLLSVNAATEKLNGEEQDPPDETVTLANEEGHDPVPLADDEIAEETDTEGTENPPTGDPQEPPTDPVKSPCEENGHTPDLSFQSPQDEYLPCRSGYTKPLYRCSICHELVTANGEDASTVWQAATEEHKFAGVNEANYGPCGGGYHENFRQCVVCHLVFDAEGKNVLERDPGNGGSHTPYGDRIRANWTPCLGGFKTEWYLCRYCSLATDADGKTISGAFSEGAPHQIVAVPGREATEDEAGWSAYYQCTVCHMSFANSEGTEYLTENITVPALREARTESLDDVPGAVSGKYNTLEDVHSALLEAAGTAGFDQNRTDADSILLDITLLQTDGDKEPVSAKEFPEEGVIVILPYPEGTDQSYTFVITHMITQGENAGQTEVLWSVNAEDGIYVYFTSMSPMSISYMSQSTTPAPAPAPAAPVVSSTVPKTSDAAHGAPWGMLALLSIGGLGALFAAGKKLRIF